MTPRHHHRLASAALLLALVAGAAAAQPAPFVADYRVLRGSMHLADARIELSRDTEDGWTLRSITEPVPFIRLVTDDVIVETSTFRVGEDGPIPLHYRYEQRNSNKNRDESYAFDWASGRVVGVARGEKVDLEGPRGTLDPLLLRIAVGSALARDALAPTYSVVERRKLHNYAVTRTAAAKLKLPAGTIETLGVERVSEDGRKTTRLMFAPSLDWLPVLIEQREVDEPTIRLELTKLHQPPTAAVQAAR